MFDPPCRNPVKSVPRGKAIWNANGGFVSVLLTHLLHLYLQTVGPAMAKARAPKVLQRT